MKQSIELTISINNYPRNKKATIVIIQRGQKSFDQKTDFKLLYDVIIIPDMTS